MLGRAVMYFTCVVAREPVQSYCPCHGLLLHAARAKEGVETSLKLNTTQLKGVKLQLDRVRVELTALTVQNRNY